MKTNEEIEIETDTFQSITDWTDYTQAKSFMMFRRLGDILKAIHAPEDMTGKTTDLPTCGWVDCPNCEKVHGDRS